MQNRPVRAVLYCFINLTNGMPQENSNIKERNRSEIDSPGQYSVIFHNDDFTPMDFVIAVIMNVFFKDIKEATHLMLKVHHEGKAMIGVYSYDIAHSKVNLATNLARQEGFPLRITVQKI